MTTFCATYNGRLIVVTEDFDDIISFAQDEYVLFCEFVSTLSVSSRPHLVEFVRNIEMSFDKMYYKGSLVFSDCSSFFQKAMVSARGSAYHYKDYLILRFVYIDNRIRINPGWVVLRNSTLEFLGSQSKEAVGVPSYDLAKLIIELKGVLNFD